MKLFSFLNKKKDDSTTFENPNDENASFVSDDTKVIDGAIPEEIQHSDAPEKVAVKKNTHKGISLDGLKLSALIRLLLALAVMILAEAGSFDKLIYVLLMAATALIAGYDVIIAAVDAIAKKNYFAYELLVLVAAVAVFATGSIREAVLMLMIYQLCVTLIDFLVFQTRSITKEYISADRCAEKTLLESILGEGSAEYCSAGVTLVPYLELFTKAAVFAGVLYAIFIPLVSDITYTDSIRRCMMIIVLASPLSVLVSLPLCMITGISHAASCGVFVRDGKTLEAAAKVNSLVIDKADVLTVSAPRLVSYTSPIFDNDTFLRLAAHVACFSTQRAAIPIRNAYKGEYIDRIISDFNEQPGNYMMIIADNNEIALSTREVLNARRVEIPDMDESAGTMYYMTVAGKYAGAILLREEYGYGANYALDELCDITKSKVLLLTEDSITKAKEVAEMFNVPDYICECDIAKKYDSVNHVAAKQKDSDVLMFVTGEEMDMHTSAELYAKVGMDSEIADILIPGYDKNALPFNGLPYAISTAKRTKTIIGENIAASIAVKLILIILAFAGVAKIWFVVLADLVVGMLTIINTTRISDESVISKLKKSF